SADGRFVAFVTAATNVVPGQVDTNNDGDVILYDRLTLGERLVSGVGGSATTTANGSSRLPTISADGAYVAFVSTSANLVPGQIDTNGTYDVFLFQVATATISLVSHAAGTPTTAATHGSCRPAGACDVFTTPGISADGAYVVYQSGFTDLVAGQSDANGDGDVFL